MALPIITIPLAGKIASVTIAAAAISLAAFKTARPSVVLYMAEDAVIGGAKAVGRGAKRVAQGTKGAVRAVKVEYSARAIDRAKRQIEREAEALRDLSPEEIAEVAEMQAAILARAEELHQQRVAPTYYARRAKSEAKVKRRGLA